jgi:adhesin transport system outer membrane protein
MKKTAKFSLLALAVLASLAVQAQNLPDPLIQAARKAVANNPEVQARWNGFKAAGDEQGVARGGFFPRVDLSASTGRESRINPTQGNLGSYDINATQLTLTQMLFDGLFTPARSNASVTPS